MRAVPGPAGAQAQGGPWPAHLRRGLGGRAHRLHAPELPVPVFTHKHRRQADVVVCQVALEDEKEGDCRCNSWSRGFKK